MMYASNVLSTNYNNAYFLKSQIRTLSDAAIYKLPDACPIETAVTGDSPTCVKPKFALPDNVVPDEQRVFIAFVWLARRSHTRTYAPHAENNILDLGSYSIASTGPACDSKATGPFILFKSHTRTVRSAAAVYKL